MQNKRNENNKEKQSLITDKPREALRSFQKQQQQQHQQQQQEQPCWLLVRLIYDDLSASCVWILWCFCYWFYLLLRASGLLLLLFLLLLLLLLLLVDSLATPTPTHHYRVWDPGPFSSRRRLKVSLHAGCLPSYLTFLVALFESLGLALIRVCNMFLLFLVPCTVYVTRACLRISEIIPENS